MAVRRKFPLLRAGGVLALLVVAAGCTKGGQFDPTTLLDNDMFSSKKPLVGQREPVFPGGVPGATSGIPQDLYKGYQPPPEQAADNGATANPASAPEAAAERAKPEAKARPKPKPKPKVVRAPATAPTANIEVSPAKRATAQPQPAQSAWPSPAAAPQAAQPAWPSPGQQAAQPSQSAWPSPTSTAQ